MANSIKAQRPNRLTEDETLTSFEDWRNNLLFYLNQEKGFQQFLKSDATWKKTSENVANRGLDSADNHLLLKNFLGVSAGLSPPLLHGDLIDDSTKLSDIFQLLRTYYQLAPTESTFIKFVSIKREIINGTLERPLHLYLRLRQFIRDNLLLSTGRIEHNGTIPTTDETLSPTTERLVVLRWLEILHPALPHHVANVFAQELQSKSLKDLQPRIAERIDDLLRHVSQQDSDQEASISFAKISSRKWPTSNRNSNNMGNSRFEANVKVFSTARGSYGKKFKQQPTTVKKCDACRSVGEPFIGHTVYKCPNIAPADLSSILKSFALEVEQDEDDDGVAEALANPNISEVNFCVDQPTNVDRVDIVSSPQFNVKINNTLITMVLDTVATGSMIILELWKLAGLHIYPSSQRAILADGDSQLRVVGEVHTSILMDNYLTLSLNACVVTKLKAGLIVGMAFMKAHNVVIDIPNNLLRVSGNNIVRFNNQPGSPKVSLLRAEINHVIFPGDSIALPAPVNFLYDMELAVEPRGENCAWCNPFVSTNETGFLSLSNEMESPIKVKKGQIIGQVRSVIFPNESHGNMEIKPSRMSEEKQQINFTGPITIDPDNILSNKEKNIFLNINNEYNDVFNPKFGTYNNKSGKVVASVHIGKTAPTPKKGKVPSYNSKKSSMLQEKFDELVDLGVLSRPEDNDVRVIHSSPSFLVKKSNDSFRLVTSFVELNKFIHLLPSKLSTTTDVLTSLGRWKFIIKTDLKSSYFQIQMDPESQQWLGTNSPYKGMYVYNRAPMGLRNMAEYLEEVVSRVLGDYLAEGILTKIADDLIIGGNTVEELSSNWSKVLCKLKDNNLSLSADKTFICPASVKIVGWMWRNGNIEVDPHRVNPLTTCPPPETVKQLRSFIGAFRAISRCISQYGKYLSPLEDAVAGRDSSEKIAWNDQLTTSFTSAQKSLLNPKVITLLHPDDQLILISDGCNSPPAVGSTLYVKRGPRLFVAGFFSAKIGKHQLLWLPCEIEALCINLSISSFSHYIRESKHETKFLTDSKACVQAFEKLSKGGFSLSPRISSYLMNLNALNVSINHTSGSSIPLTDFSSRNPISCVEQSCQVCRFVNEHIDLAVRSVSVSDIESGIFNMPFYNPAAWRGVQKDDTDLKRCFSQLHQGTRPGKKEKNLKLVRRYLQVASISNAGILIHRKSNPYGKDFELIIVPEELTVGLITALHLRLGHLPKTQFRKIWDRYYFALNAEKVIDDVTHSCSLCNSMKTLPKELMKQSTSAVPDTVGRSFSADVIRRENQKIFVLLDIFSSFVVGKLLANEQHQTLREALIQLSVNYKHPDGCIIRVDNAPGFQALRDDKLLAGLGITLDFGRIKNKNQNPCVDRAIQDIEKKIKRLAPNGGQISTATLAIAYAPMVLVPKKF